MVKRRDAMKSSLFRYRIFLKIFVYCPMHFLALLNIFFSSILFFFPCTPPSLVSLLFPTFSFLTNVIQSVSWAHSLTFSLFHAGLGLWLFILNCSRNKDVLSMESRRLERIKFTSSLLSCSLSLSHLLSLL